MVLQILNFVNRDLWRLRARTLKGPRGFLLRALRILILSGREFNSDQCSLRASALTYYSLLSIVPVFAMAFGLAKGFGMDKVLKEQLIQSAEGQQEIFSQIIGFSENLLQNTRGGLIAGIGILFLFWTVIKVLGNIEQSFNHIWGIKKERTLGRKFTDYLSLMMIAPIIFLVGSSATVFIISQITAITEKISILGPLAPLILTSLKLLPFVVFWGLLTYLYIFLPNGKIQFKSALLGGVVGGTIYQIVQWAYIHFQIGASNAGAIYGSFAALPLFLIWLQTSWVILLYGAELAFAHQNDDTFEFESDCLSASQKTKKLLSLQIAELCVSRFTQGEPPLSAEAIADCLEIPIRLTHELLFRLVQANLLAAMEGASERERRYQPSRDVGEMTVQFVLQQLDMSGTNDIPVLKSPALENLSAALAAFESAVEKLPENRLLKDLRTTTLLSSLR